MSISYRKTLFSSSLHRQLSWQPLHGWCPYLQERHLLPFRPGRTQPYPDRTASSSRLYIWYQSEEQIRSSCCHLLLQGTLLPLAASAAQLHHRSYQRLCMQESCQGFPEDSLWL